jgi:hypothetical protein
LSSPSSETYAERTATIGLQFLTCGNFVALLRALRCEASSKFDDFFESISRDTRFLADHHAPCE